MTDYIDRQAAIDALCKVGCGSGYCGISCDDVKAIEQLPSAEVEPVKHGRWKRIDGQPHIMECSECGSLSVENRYNYCPSCGAKMDKEEGEKHD